MTTALHNERNIAALATLNPIPHPLLNKSCSTLPPLLPLTARLRDQKKSIKVNILIWLVVMAIVVCM
jgi:hypothetical protein